MITIFSSTNRKNSYSYKMANTYLSILSKKNIKSQIFDFQELPIDFVFSNAYGKTTIEFDFLVKKFLIKIDKYIFICPEYNGSIPGVLKSFIDCTNFKLYKSKKISIVGVASGQAGNLRGIDHLTSIFHHLGSEVHSIKPKFSNIQEAFKKNKLINKKYEEKIHHHINEFIKF